MIKPLAKNIEDLILELEDGLEVVRLSDERRYEEEKDRLAKRCDETYMASYRILQTDLEHFAIRQDGRPCVLLGFRGPDLCEAVYSWQRYQPDGARPPDWMIRATEKAAAILAVRFLLHLSWSPDCVVEDGVHCLEDGTVLHVKDGVLDNENGPAVKLPDGSIVYYRNGAKSRLKGAAVIAADGSRAYFFDGRLHRTTGAAISTASGHREFWRDDVLHRKNRPAIIHPDGSVQYAENGVTGRKRAPSIIRSDGTRKYHRDGYLHNEVGPAISQGLIRREWWIDGRNLEDESGSARCGQDEFDERLRRQKFRDTLFVQEVFPGSLRWYQQAMAARRSR